MQVWFGSQPKPFHFCSSIVRECQSLHVLLPVFRALYYVTRFRRQKSNKGPIVRFPLSRSAQLFHHKREQRNTEHENTQYPDFLASPSRHIMPSSDPTFPLFSTFAFLGFVLSVIPLPWHFQAWNSGTCAFMLWVGCFCLVLFINSLIWADNALNTVPVWCDICMLFEYEAWDSLIVF